MVDIEIHALRSSVNIEPHTYAKLLERDDLLVQTLSILEEAMLLVPGYNQTLLDLGRPFGLSHIDHPNIESMHDVVDLAHLQSHRMLELNLIEQVSPDGYVGQALSHALGISHLANIESIISSNLIIREHLIIDAIKQLSGTKDLLWKIVRLQPEFGISTFSVQSVLEKLETDLSIVSDEYTRTLLSNDFTFARAVTKGGLFLALDEIVRNSNKYGASELSVIADQTTTGETTQLTLGFLDNGLGMNKATRDSLNLDSSTFQISQRQYNNISGTGLGVGIISKLLQVKPRFEFVEIEETSIDPTQNYPVTMSFSLALSR